MKVPVIKVAKPCVGDEEIEAVAQVLRSGNYVSGKKVKRFESEFAEYVGTDYAVGVSSGTSAIYLTLQALGIGAGDEVIVPALTFFSTASAVLRLGATPIFADINPDTYCLSPADTVTKINIKTKAIIPVSFYGLPAEMLWFEVLGENKEIFILEDACQAHSAMIGERKSGSFGDAGFFSFMATKNLTCAVNAGMVTTNNEELADKIRILRNHGMTDRNTHAYLGHNDMMDEIAAAVGLVQLRNLDSMNETRIENSMYLRRQLSDVPWLKVPPIPVGYKHVFFWANFDVNEVELGMSTGELRKRLLEKGVETRHRYTQPLYKQPILEQFNHLHRYDLDNCPNAEKIAGVMIGLPNWPGIPETDLDRVIKAVKEQ